MRIANVSRQPTRNIAWALALVCALAAGVALGRWGIADSSTASPDRAAVDVPVFAMPNVEVPDDAGHVIGMTLEASGAADRSSDAIGAGASPDSSGLGHVIGITFDATGSVAAEGQTLSPGSLAEGHVIGVRFR